MNAFAYLRDPLFLFCCGLYALNRFLMAPASGNVFLTGHLDDVLLIPCALPVVLWVHRRLGWREDDRPPTPAEIALHLLIWSVICEGLGPRIFPNAISDPWDVLAYATGGVLAWFYWKFCHSTKSFLIAR